MTEETRYERQKRGKLEANTNASGYSLGKDTEGTIGRVTNPEARAFSPESRLIGGVTREDVGKRFQGVDATNIRGSVTEVKDLDSIGVVPDSSARSYGDRQEPAFVGLERRLGGELKDRFWTNPTPVGNENPAIPDRGVTVPTTPSPSISEGVMTSPPRKQDLQAPATGPTQSNPASIYHEAEHDAIERERQDNQSTSTQGSGPNPAFRRKQGRPIDERGEDE
jgi:hypothetical protein